MQNIFIEFLPPWVETGLQPAFYDKESGTVLQQVSRMYAKMNELIGNVNKFEKDTKDTVDEYIAKFVELHDYVHDYFDNLDVQEEINNKLDDMAESGQLTEIIGAYLQTSAIWAFDTVADMKLSQNLVDGAYARTLGFHNINDGGGAIYKISDTGTANEMDVIAVGDLYATLVLPEILAPEQVGCYGDGTSNDTTAFARACSLSKFVQGKGNYLINTITLENVNIKANIYAREITGVTFGDNVTFEGTLDHTVGGTVDDNAVGIYITGDNCLIQNSLFKAELYTGIAIGVYDTSKETQIINCKFAPDYKIDIWASGDSVVIDKCIFDEHTANTLATLSVYGNGIKVSKYRGVGEANHDNIKITNNTLYEHGDNPIDCYTGATNVLIDGNYINSPTHNNLEIKADGENEGENNHHYVISNNIMYGARNIRILNNHEANLNNIIIGNNQFHTTAGSCLILEEVFDCVISNCQFTGDNQSSITAIGRVNQQEVGRTSLTVSNCTFDNFYAIMGDGTGFINADLRFDNIVCKNIARFARFRSGCIAFFNNCDITTSGQMFWNCEGSIFANNCKLTATNIFVGVISSIEFVITNCILNASSAVFVRNAGTTKFNYALIGCDYTGSASLGNVSMGITDTVAINTIS